MKKTLPFQALKIPIFRNFLLAAFLSEIGNQMQIVAIAWQVYELTRNPASLGLIGLANIIPILLFSLIGGLTADKVDRKKLLVYSQAIMACLAFILFLLTFFHIINPLMIYLSLVFIAIAQAFSMPARQAVLPNLVPKEYFMNAVSLNSLQYQSATMLGPAIAGLLIAGFGVATVYFFNAVSFLIFIFAVISIKVSLNAEHRDIEFNIESIMEGIKFVVKTPILYSTMILDFLATFLGTANILMPVFAKEILHVGPTGLGLLYSAPAIGAVIAGVLMSLIKHIENQGKVIIIAVIFYGIAIIGFGLSNILPLSIFFLILMGFSDMISTVIRNTVRQMVTPDHLRGRMVSIMRIFFQGGPQLGDMEAGLLASAIGAPISVAIGGAGVVFISIFVAYLNPKLRGYQGKE